MNQRVILKTEKLTKVFPWGDDKINAVKEVSMQINEGQFVVIAGPSGSGKTTLLTLLGLLQKYDNGKLYLEKVDISMLTKAQKSYLRSQKIGFIFQNYNLVDYLSAIDNVKLMQYIARKPGNDEAMNILRAVGLEDKADYLPHQLSGGQQQRVAIARALVNKPSFILADEPTGNLDSKSGDEIIKLMEDLCRKNNKTMIVVTHDENLYKRADQVYHMQDGKLTK